MARSINLLVIHCAATPSGKPLQQGKPGQPGYLNAPQVINAWHAARGFKRDPAACRAFNSHLPSIGYHYVIDLTGEVWTGRAHSEIGAHALNYNANSLGICLVGGAEREGRYTPKQWESLQKVVSMLCNQYVLPTRPPQRKWLGGANWAIHGGVCGHRDLSPDKDGNGLVEAFEWLKTCPGFNVSDWLSTAMTPDPKNVFKETV